LYSSEYGPYDLGFFGGIVIEGDNIIVDGNGKSIRMSGQFQLNQRFFSIINISSSPFLPRTGPANFGGMVSPKNITIKNIILGSTSHNGILGNNNVNVKIKNVKIVDFEVSGITLNNCDNVIIEDCQIKNANKEVMVNGKYASFFFAFQKIRDVRFYHFLDQEVKKIYNEFEKIYNVVNEEYKKYKTVNYCEFKNPSKLTDGLQYGISISEMGPSVNGFSACSRMKNSDHQSENIIIRNTLIRNLCANPKMIKGYYKEKPLILNQGRLLDKDDYKLPSVMALLKFYDYCYKKEPTFLKSFQPMTIREEDIKNIVHQNVNLYKCYVNGDIMNHLSKPMMGIRLQCVKDCNLENVQIDNIKNVGKYFSLKNCVKHKHSDFNCYTGADVIGLCLINTTIKKENVTIKNMKSKNGLKKLIFKYEKHIELK